MTVPFGLVAAFSFEVMLVRPKFMGATSSMVLTVVLAAAGVPAGAVGVQDIGPHGFVQFGDAVYFVDYDGDQAGQHGMELWRTDGSVDGTVLVKDIVADPAGGGPYPLGVAGGTLYLQVLQPSGPELWKSDGTTDGTVFVTELDSSNIMPLGAVGTDFLFASQADPTSDAVLWRTDGSAGGTASVEPVGGHILSTAVMGGSVYFVAEDATHGFELWKSDGTAPGTKRLTDLNPGSGDGVPTPALKAWSGTLYFTGDDGTHGAELWSSDGTAGGTHLVKDIRPGSGNSYPDGFTPIGSSMVMVANDGVHGQELWKTNGTGAGTKLVKDLTPGNRLSSQIDHLTKLGKKAVFTGRRGLYRTNGTGHGTRAVWPEKAGGPCCMSGLTFVPGEGVLFAGAGPAPFPGVELWRTNGWRNGTEQVEDINPGTASSKPSEIHALPNGGAVFDADDGVHGIELWGVTQGVSGAHLVKDITP